MDSSPALEELLRPIDHRRNLPLGIVVGITGGELSRGVDVGSRLQDLHKRTDDLQGALGGGYDRRAKPLGRTAEVALLQGNRYLQHRLARQKHGNGSAVVAVEDRQITCSA